MTQQSGGRHHRSRLGRRLIALFIACAVAPLLIAAIFLFGEFDQTLHRSQQDELNKDLRFFGMSLFNRLTSADDSLNGALRGDARSPSEIAAALKGLPWIASFKVESVTDAAAHRLPAVSGALGDGPNRNRAALVWDRDASQGARLYLVRELRGRERLWIEISQPWLWSDADSFFPESSLAIVGGAAGLVYRQSNLPQGETTLHSGWDLFLGSHFASDSWHLSVNRGATTTLAMLRDARFVFPTIVAITILVVSLLAIGMIRRQMRPLQKLVDGTRRIARRDFNTPIEIEGTDEFHGLAQSFNEMTNDLRQQFAALETLSDVDRLLLQSPAIEDVLDALLPKVSDILGCTAVSVVLTDEDSAVHARVYDFCRGGPAIRPVRRVAVQVSYLEAACERYERPGDVLLEPDVATLIEPLVEAGARTFSLHALKAGQTLSGILLIGFDGVAAAQRDMAVRPAEFAARLSVALDKIAQTARLHRQAHFDSLTGLANRRLFIERLQAEVGDDGDTGRQGAILYIDLDHFKRVNDTEGHGAGDQLLCAVADRLKESIGSTGIAARLGGDEFAVLLPGISDVDAIRLLAQQVLKAVAAPIEFGGRSRNINASIGIALYPTDAATTEGLLMSSDVAMYRAKELGRGQTVFFKAEMQRRLEAVAAIETGLHRALHEQKLLVVYQPIFASSDRHMHAVEALVRWPSAPGEPTRSPAQFIPVAEESGLIVELGAWVLNTACRQYMSWRRQGLALDYISVNVSVRQLVDNQLLGAVKLCLEQCGMRPEELQLEITESVLAEAGATIGTIQALAAMGVRLALDDFGTGFSSLSYLRTYPIHTIKIDQSFVRDLPGNATACRLVEAMLAMAHAVQRDVVAEGVETQSQLDFLTAAGCGDLQGYLLGRPMEAADLLSFAGLSRTDDSPPQPLRSAAGG